MKTIALEMIKNAFRRQEVEVLLPDKKYRQTLSLAFITVKTNKLQDFLKIYGGKVASIHIEMARKIFGDGESENTYGVFFDKRPNPEMVFAFDIDFAQYDKGRKEVIVKDIDEVLMEKLIIKK